MVIGELTPEMGRLYWAIDNALAEPGRSAKADRSQRRLDLLRELKAVGCKLSPERFGDQAHEILGTLYPQWTVDDLACHPHDAIQFCEVVRTKVGSPVPDPLIMRILLHRQKRSHFQHP